MNTYFDEFIHNESGVETMEWIAILGVTAILIGILVRVSKTMEGKLKGVASHL